VATAGRDPPAAGFRLRKLTKPEEFRQVEELQRSVGEADSGGIVSPPLQRLLQDHGGLVLGAFADIYLAGATVSTLGWDGSALFHLSVATVVRPEYRNHQLGFRLKAYQRDEVLGLGLSEVRWVFDPLASRTARLGVRRLGARPDRYLPHYFGQLPDAANRGEETDRLHVRWPLTDPEVEARLAGRFPSAADDRARLGRVEAVVVTEAGASGLRLPTEVVEPTGASAHLEIPFDFEGVRQHEPAAVRRWRHAVRDAFRMAFDLGYRVDDFAVISAEHERRSFYFLERGPASGGPGPA
jgi:predicted GNAT superfamily acetyltransferase